ADELAVRLVRRRAVERVAGAGAGDRAADAGDGLRVGERGGTRATAIGGGGYAREGADGGERDEQAGRSGPLGDHRLLRGSGAGRSGDPSVLRKPTRPCRGSRPSLRCRGSSSTGGRPLAVVCRWCDQLAGAGSVPAQKIHKWRG